MSVVVDTQAEIRRRPGPRTIVASIRLRGLASLVFTAAIVLVGLLMVVFAIGRLLPVDPVLVVIGDRAPQALYDETFRAMRLDRPLIEQFAMFSLDLLGGKLGTSITTGNPVASDLLRFFPATLELATVAILIGVLVGLPAGVVAARYAGRWPDHVARLISLLGLSVPTFWLGLVGLLVLYATFDLVRGPGRLDIAYQYTIPEVTGLVLVDTLLAGDVDAFRNAVSHVVLPAGLLGLIAIGYIARMTRGFLLWQMRQDYVNVARLKGLSEATILWRHAMPNVIGPILAVIAWTYAYLLEGAVLTETVFAWPGLGLYLTQSLFAADIPAVLAGTLLIGVLFMLLNILAEVAQGALDPRVGKR